ncbi:MAG: hypothetical protein D6681_04410 [Calditrichaeota bacterium]|nr:MAG: hypothetical protein D6681_04410 [Calditrichota bacterium]
MGTSLCLGLLRYYHETFENQDGAEAETAESEKRGLEASEIEMGAKIGDSILPPLRNLPICFPGSPLRWL